MYDSTVDGMGGYCILYYCWFICSLFALGGHFSQTDVSPPAWRLLFFASSFGRECYSPWEDQGGHFVLYAMPGHFAAERYHPVRCGVSYIATYRYKYELLTGPDYS